jgi:O-methyltransferase
LNRQFKKLLPNRIKKSVKALLSPQSLAYLGSRTSYSQDGLVSIMSVDFLNDSHFRDSFTLGAETGSWGENPENNWRVFVACWAARNCSQLEGDFVECGVYKGGLARAIMHYVNFNALKKTFFLFDTFKGIDESQLTELEISHGLSRQYSHYKQHDVYEEVKLLFRKDNVKIIRGRIPDTFKGIEISKVAFLSIDMNCAKPELASIDHFWRKLVPGAIVVFDDYEWPQHEEQRLVLNKFASQNNTQILPLPTGQGLLVKN